MRACFASVEAVSMKTEHRGPRYDWVRVTVARYSKCLSLLYEDGNVR